LSRFALCMFWDNFATPAL